MSQSEGFKPLTLKRLDRAPQLPQANRSASLNDPALSLLTDLHHGPCVVARQDDGLDETLHLMQRAGVRMVFVSGANADLVGLCTADDLLGERPVLRASVHHVPHDELRVADVMTPVTQWDTIDLVEVRTAKLGEVAATMHDHGLRYLIVTQHKDDKVVLRGLFSARRLEQALDTKIESDLHSRSFAELEQVLAAR